MVHRLPTELRREIFFQATYVPHLLDTKWDYDPDERIWEGWRFEKDTENTTKCAIVQVCWEWRTVGMEFLYQTIQIPNYADQSRYNQLHSLAEALSPLPKPSRQSDVTDISPFRSSSRGYGWWTKRLDCPRDILRYDNYRYFASILDQCPNLSILTITQGSIFGDGVSNGFGVIQSRLYHSLRRLDFKVRDDNFSLLNFTSIPLYSLEITFTGSIIEVPHSCSFATISSLTLYFTSALDNCDESFYLPNLRHLALRKVRDDDFIALNRLVSRHSQTLFSLYLQTLYTCESLPELLHLPLHLRSLAFDDGDLLNLDSTYPGITHLGIFPESGSLEQYARGITRMLDDKIFPHLTVLRMLRLDNVPFQIKWANVIERCASAGVRLQNSRGHLLSYSEPEIPVSQILVFY